MRVVSGRSALQRLRGLSALRSPLVLAVALAAFALPFAARAEGEAPAEAGGQGEAACTASSTDEQCAEYWEDHINFWSWDYKESPDQRREHRHMPPPFGFALINFAVFGFIMFRLAGKPLAEFVRTRHVTIKKDLDEAAALRAEAAAKLKEYQDKVAGIDAEIEALLTEFKRAAELEKARLVAAAAEQAARLKADAEAQIKSELNRTLRELRREAVTAAIAAAEAVLRDKLSLDDQKRLADRYVAELEGSTPAVAVRS